MSLDPHRPWKPAEQCSRTQETEVVKETEIVTSSPEQIHVVSIGTWNVRTVKGDSPLHILGKELDNWKCDIFGISETHRRGTEEMCIYKWLQIYCSQGVDDGTSRSGVGVLLGNLRMLRKLS